MRKKNYLLIMTLATLMTSCIETSSSSSSSSSISSSSISSSNNELGLKYEIVDGEVVINDEVLTKSNEIETSNNNRVFYEIFTGSFSDSNGDGIGDLQGIINRLDYLNDGKINSGRSLGVQGIWLTPIFASPSYHKYDITDYYKIDPSFGDMTTLKSLIDECHKRNIKIILDLPINHTGHLNQWFLQFKHAHATNDETNPYYNFYTYYKMGEQPPTNNTFRLVPGTDSYYECNFSSEMPELNFDNELVRETVLDIAKYYLDLGVDGFRFDAAKYIYFGNHEKSADFWGWYVNELKKIKSDIYTVGEVWDPDAVTDIYYKKGLGCFNFSMSGAEGKIALAAKGGPQISAYTKYVKTYYDTIKKYDEDAIMYSFITNHDMDRTAGFLPMLNKTCYMGASIELLSPGSPFIYYGDEIGIKGSRSSENTDANRRLKMRWGDGDTVKNPIGTTYEESKQTNGTVTTQIGNEQSLLTHYKKLIMIRNAYPEIHSGSFQALSYDSSNTNVGGFLYTLNDSNVAVIHNTAKNTKARVDLSNLTNVQLKSLEIYLGNGTASLENNVLTIEPLTTVVLK